MSNRLVQTIVTRQDEPPTVAFYGTASPFSNFHSAKIDFLGHIWPTSEHLFMAWKALLFHDTDVFEKLKHAKTPAEAKNLGRTVKKNGSEPFPIDEWNEQSYEIMKGILQFKFLQNPDLKKKLIDAVVDEHGVPVPCVFAEVTAKDARWGTGCDLDAFLRKEDTGMNHLGIALSAVRSELLAPPVAAPAAVTTPSAVAAASAAMDNDGDDEARAQLRHAAIARLAEKGVEVVMDWDPDDWAVAVAAVQRKRQRRDQDA